jgi:predicted metal-binding membrane protein
MTTTTTAGIPSRPAPGTGRDPAVALWAVAGICWAATIALTLTGGAEAAHHDHVLEHDTLPWAVRIAEFLAVWTVMLGAMMLPTLVPLARMFGPVSGRAPRPRTARAGLYGGYLLVWLVFAPVALVFDTTIHLTVHSWPWLADHVGLILAATLVLVGAYQLSPMKDRCLTACRDPFGFLWQYYRRGLRGAMRLGARHALWCLGCCWALMLLMFATGVGSLAWMLGLTGVMVAEKTTRWGARLVVPIGVVLLLAGAVLGGLALLGVPVGPQES